MDRSSDEKTPGGGRDRNKFRERSEEGGNPERIGKTGSRSKGSFRT